MYKIKQNQLDKLKKEYLNKDIYTIARHALSNQKKRSKARLTCPSESTGGCWGLANAPTHTPSPGGRALGLGQTTSSLVTACSCTSSASFWEASMCQLVKEEPVAEAAASRAVCLGTRRCPSLSP